MRFISIFTSILLAGCAAQLPPNLARQDPSHPNHRHTSRENLFAGTTPFRPVPAGDWRQLNRNVTPEEKKP